MISYFYQQNGRLLLALVALTFPFFYWQANTIKSNNDIETWLPRKTEVRQEYERFKREFGAEEIIVVALERSVADPQLVESLAGRLERLAGIRAVWTPERMTEQMASLGVPRDEAQRRIQGLLEAPSGELIGIVALMSEAGAKDRAGVVAAVRRELDYCRLQAPHAALNGAPVVVTELDRLGSQHSSRRFFMITMLVCLTLLYVFFGHWGMAWSTLGITLWGIYVTQTVLAWCGGEMNFIMGSLSVMVMIFTLSIAVHFVSYYSEAKQAGAADPLALALKEAWNPCALSTVTTLLGLISLNVSDILPVAQFGYAAALGAIIALAVGLGIMPALTVVWPHCETRSLCFRLDYGEWADFVAAHRKQILALAGVLVVLTGVGLLRLQSDVDPVEFLPRQSSVLADLQRIERDLTGVDSIEAVVDFGDSDLPFVDRMLKVRTLEKKIGAHPGVRHTLSAASFFPEELPDSAFAAARMLSRAQANGADAGWVVDDQRLWRISARLHRQHGLSPVRVLNDLEQQLAGEPVRFTGLAPLLKSAQIEIFNGFWQSFTAACLTISLVMILSLRSLLAGIVAMVPNIIPIWLVFGGLGFLGTPVDIGMMMTGSIALGISVDCTFHFLVHYREAYRGGCTSPEACRRALIHSGEPMLESTLICSLGMLALCLSSFVPTARFGGMMAAQMLASVLGELVILPALLCVRPKRRESRWLMHSSHAAVPAAPHCAEPRPVREYAA
uniref:RND transporter n=1 Tax=Schlesneria paludicola TaxID=360056 RepID=A0A7C4LMM0_9PLAN